jgi:hypothetical protein
VRHPVEENTSLFTLLASASTICQPIQQEIKGTLCLACDHFIGCHRDANGNLLVHCWSHQKVRLARGTQTLPVQELQDLEND